MKRSRGNSREASRLVYLDLTPYDKLMSIGEVINKGDRKASTPKARTNKRINRLIGVRIQNDAQKAEWGIVEHEFILMRNTQDGRTLLDRRQRMTRKIAHLKNLTLVGKNMQWCMVGP